MKARDVVKSSTAFRKKDTRLILASFTHTIHNHTWRDKNVTSFILTRKHWPHVRLNLHASKWGKKKKKKAHCECEHHPACTFLFLDIHSSALALHNRSSFIVGCTLAAPRYYSRTSSIIPHRPRPPQPLRPTHSNSLSAAQAFP